MFFQKSYIDKLLSCHLCNERFSDEKQPLILPCGETVCSKCVATIEFNELTVYFKCISCHNYHLNPNGIFPLNQTAKDFLSIELIKNKLLVDDLSEKIKIERNNFKKLCQELKNKVTQSANKRVEEINNNLQQCLNRVDLYEREYDQNQSNFSFDLKARFESSKLENNRIEIEINENGLESDILGFLFHKNKDMHYSTIISCSDDFIKVFSLESGKQLKTYKGHVGNVNCLKIILQSNTYGETESKYIASGSDDMTIKIWDIKSGVCVTTLEGHLEAVKCLEVLSENILASGSTDYMIKLWNLDYQTCVMTLNGHIDWVNYIAKLNNELFVSCSDDKLIKVWRSFTGKCLYTLKGHSGYVKCVKKVSDEKIISCSSDNTIKLWCLNKKKCVRTFSGHEFKVNHLEMISADIFLSCSDDNTIRYWSIKSGECLKILTGPMSNVNCVQVVSEKRIVSCSDDKRIEIWDLTDGKCIKTIDHYAKIKYILLN